MIVVIKFPNNSSVTDRYRSSHTPEMYLAEICVWPVTQTSGNLFRTLKWILQSDPNQVSSYLVELCCPCRRGGGAAARGRNARWCGRSPRVSRCCRSRAPRWWWGRCRRWRGWNPRRCCGARCPWCPWGSAPAGTQSCHCPCHTYCSASWAQGTARAVLSTAHPTPTEEKSLKHELEQKRSHLRTKQSSALSWSLINYTEVVKLKSTLKSDIWTSSITDP